MLQVTDKAVEGINQMMKEDEKVGSMLRIYAAGMSCSGIHYALAYEDKVNEGDKKVELSGVTFVMDDLTLNDMDGAKLDYTQSPQGGGLFFDMPKKADGCSSCTHCG